MVDIADGPFRPESAHVSARVSFAVDLETANSPEWRETVQAAFAAIGKLASNGNGIQVEFEITGPAPIDPL